MGDIDRAINSLQKAGYSDQQIKEIQRSARSRGMTTSRALIQEASRVDPRYDKIRGVGTQGEQVSNVNREVQTVRDESGQKVGERLVPVQKEAPRPLNVPQTAASQFKPQDPNGRYVPIEQIQNYKTVQEGNERRTSFDVVTDKGTYSIQQTAPVVYGQKNLNGRNGPLKVQDERSSSYRAGRDSGGNSGVADSSSSGDFVWSVPTAKKVAGAAVKKFGSTLVSPFVGASKIVQNADLVPKTIVFQGKMLALASDLKAGDYAAVRQKLPGLKEEAMYLQKRSQYVDDPDVRAAGIAGSFAVVGVAGAVAFPVVTGLLSTGTVVATAAYRGYRAVRDPSVDTASDLAVAVALPVLGYGVSKGAAAIAPVLGSVLGKVKVKATTAYNQAIYGTDIASASRNPYAVVMGKVDPATVAVDPFATARMNKNIIDSPGLKTVDFAKGRVYPENPQLTLAGKPISYADIRAARSPADPLEPITMFGGKPLVKDTVMGPAEIAKRIGGNELVPSRQVGFYNRYKQVSRDYPALEYKGEPYLLISRTKPTLDIFELKPVLKQTNLQDFGINKPLVIRFGQPAPLKVAEPKVKPVEVVKDVAREVPAGKSVLVQTKAAPVAESSYAAQDVMFVPEQAYESQRAVFTFREAQAMRQDVVSGSRPTMIPFSLVGGSVNRSQSKSDLKMVVAPVTRQDQSIKFLPASAQASRSKMDQVVLSKSASSTKFSFAQGSQMKLSQSMISDQALASKQLQALSPRLAQGLRISEFQAGRTARSRANKTQEYSRPKMPSLPGFKQERRGKFASGFDVYVKSRGKFLKVNTGALPRGRAFKLGARVVDETTAATFQVRAAKRRVSGSDSAVDLSKFRTKRTKAGIVNIEKNLYRISSKGEFRGITVEGWLANRRKSRRR